MLFDRFKMSLYKMNEESGRVDINYDLRATNEKRYSSELVFVAAFKQIQKEAKSYLGRLDDIDMNEISEDEIQWIITVPAIWNDEAKNTMKEWAMKAGLIQKDIPNQCKIVYEPDCASLAIQYEISQRTKKEQQQEQKQQAGSAVFSHAGDRYILVDGGGGM